jgi:hypothetical protein
VVEVGLPGGAFPALMNMPPRRSIGRPRRAACGGGGGDALSEPRLLIDDHTPKIAFTLNGHLKKLRDEPYSLQVQMVKGHRDWALDVHL